MTDNFVFDNAQVISKNATMKGEIKRIEVALIGEPVEQDVIDNIKSKMKLNDRLDRC